MKITKIILTTIMIVVAALGLFRILPFNITNSIMFTSLATLLLLRSIEWKKSRDKTGFLFTFIAAVFIYIVVIFNICSSLLGYEKVDNRDCLKDINPSEIVEIKCSGTTGGKDGHFEYFLDERQQEVTNFLDKEQRDDFVELLGKVKLGRKAEREETLSSGAVTYYTLEFEDGEVLEVSPGRFFMVNDDYYYFLNYDKIWDEFLEL